MFNFFKIGMMAHMQDFIVVTVKKVYLKSVKKCSKIFEILNE